jgi:cholesterol transport system auxiliary component
MTSGPVHGNNPSNRMAALPPTEVSAPRANAALSGQAVLYRLTYADAQALKPYTLARWSMPPAQLIDQRLREQLGLRRAVLGTGELMATPPPGAAPRPQHRHGAINRHCHTALNLRLELEEFSQLFEAQDQSKAMPAATACHADAAQRRLATACWGNAVSCVQKLAAATPDAAGGVRALAAAADQAIRDIERWLAQVQAGSTAP